MAKPAVKRWLKRLAWTAGIAFVAVAGFVTWALTTCFAEPPALAERPAILDAEPARDGPRTRLGESWFEYRPGHSLLHLKGDPFTIGYTNSALTAELLEEQERSLIDNVRTFLPSTFALYTAATLVLVHNRRLPDYVPTEYQHEIHGLSRSRNADPYSEFGSRYHRILNYHAAHDISHWIQDTPAVGCTAFAASGARTASGNLIVGRNFDWESGAHFDVNKVIALYRPTKGHAFLSVVWPGMAGAVSGMNDAKLFCSINGAHTEHMGLGVGTPVAIVLREILQYDADLDSAAERIRKAKVFVADSFLIADGKTGKAIVVEKTPVTCAVREMEHDQILQSNHFETEALAADAGNLGYMRDGTSVARRDRLAELLSASSGALDPTRAAQILRDRQGPGGVERALGHRAAINAMIGTHSVVADVTRGILWVSRGRHQLGQFDAYSIEGFGAPVAEPIPADPALADGSFARLEEFRRSLASLPTEATALELEAVRRLNPLDPDILSRLGDAHAARGDTEAARRFYHQALAAWPPFGPDRRRLEALLTTK